MLEQPRIRTISPSSSSSSETAHLAPVGVLVVLAPTIAELLLGNLRFNAAFIPTLVMDVALYGSGAVLVREVARRRRLGWTGILILGVAFGLVEEGLVLQTVFNPHFPGLALLDAYGRAAGVSWFWLIGVLAMHAVWSITLPILLTERLFRSLAEHPWLGRGGLVFDVVVYALTGILMWHFFTSVTHFSAVPATLLVTVIAVVVLVGLALLAPSRLTPSRLTPSRAAVLSTAPRRNAPSPFVVGSIALLAGVGFFGIQLFFPTAPTIPPLVPLLLYGMLYACVVGLIRRWSAAPGWTMHHRLALAAGALLTYMLYGSRLAAHGSRADLLLHAAVCVVIAGLVVCLWSRRMPTTAP